MFVFLVLILICSFAAFDFVTTCTTFALVYFLLAQKVLFKPKKGLIPVP